MTKSAISVRNISKKYRISHKYQKNTHRTLKDDFVRIIRKNLEFVGAAGGMQKEDFYALNDISFEVAKGDVVGIMGPNGSGKSTLFKILSQVTQPSTGEIIIRGKVASLLEVGTGFHPELSGRENVYFNGAILGMKKKEIDEKFDQIVAFSEVEKFIDTPVKFYSSGMKVRLAFSVAAFLDPDILIIDEVLAVGDVKFKQKSLKHIQKLADSGTTILFVSHIISQIKKICNRGIVLSEGKIILDDSLDNAISKYMELNEPDEDDPYIKKSDPSSATESDEVKIANIDVDTNQTNNGVDIAVNFEIKNISNFNLDDIRFSFAIADELNRVVSIFANTFINKDMTIPERAHSNFSLSIPSLPLYPGRYKIRFELTDKRNTNLKYYRTNNLATFIVNDYGYKKINMKEFNHKATPIMFDFDMEIKNEE